MDEFKNKYGKKDTVDNYMTKKDSEVKYIFTTTFFIIDIILVILIFTIGTNEIKILKENYSFLNELGYWLIGIGIIFTLIKTILTAFLILTNNFIKENDKTAWLFGVIFIPWAEGLFLDYKNNITN